MMKGVEVREGGLARWPRGGERCFAPTGPWGWAIGGNRQAALSGRRSRRHRGAVGASAIFGRPIEGLPSKRSLARWTRGVGSGGLSRRPHPGAAAGPFGWEDAIVFPIGFRSREGDPLVSWGIQPGDLIRTLTTTALSIFRLGVFGDGAGGLGPPAPPPKDFFLPPPHGPEGRGEGGERGEGPSPSGFASVPQIPSL